MIQNMFKCSAKFQYFSTPFQGSVQNTGKFVSGISVRVRCQFYLPFIASKFMNILITMNRLCVMQQLVCGMHLATVLWIMTFKRKSYHFNLNEIFIVFVIGIHFECANRSEILFYNLFSLL